MIVYYLPGAMHEDVLRHSEGLYGGETLSKFMGRSRYKDIVIKKGETAHRVSSNRNENNSGHAFVSFDPNDHARYVLDGTSDDSPIGGNAHQLYSIDMKVINDIVAPSYKKSLDAFREAVNNIGLDKVSKSVQKQYGKEYNAEHFINDFKDWTVREARDGAYVAFLSTLMDDATNRKEFFNILRKQGYNAVIDEYDSNFGKTSALIVFDRDNNLKVVDSRKIDKDDLIYLMRQVASSGNRYKALDLNRMKKRWNF